MNVYYTTPCQEKHLIVDVIVDITILAYGIYLLRQSMKLKRVKNNPGGNGQKYVKKDNQKDHFASKSRCGAYLNFWVANNNESFGDNMQSTSDPIYKLDKVLLFEAIYGKNLISLGSLDAIDNMFSDIDLSGLKALDIGFGLGGVAFYLANKYQIEVTGVEIHNWMVEYAKAHAPRDIAHLLKFATYNEAGEIPFKSASFDLVYSKGVLNHVRDKDSLFREINRVIKTNGLIVIADWIYPETNVTDDSSLLVNETQETYHRVLEKTGFIAIDFRNDSKIFVGFVKKLLENITKCKEFIEKEFGIEIFSEILNDHQKLIDDINHKRKFAVRIKAQKKYISHFDKS